MRRDLRRSRPISYRHSLICCAWALCLVGAAEARSLLPREPRNRPAVDSRYRHRFATNDAFRETQKYAAGITFLVDRGPTTSRVRVGPFGTFEAVITFAAGRGRLDMLQKDGVTTTFLAGLQIGAPLAEPGDYYLFDSTGFILVRPAQRTFSSFAISDYAYDYEYSRAGWPDLFEFSAPHRSDSVSGTGAVETHGELRAF